MLTVYKGVVTSVAPYIGAGQTIFPAEAATSVTGGFFSVVADNILPILLLMGIMLGVGFVVRKFGAAKKGRI